MPHGYPRRFMRAELSPRSVSPVPGLRCPVPEDAESLARLMFAAYEGTIDQEEQSEAEALAEVHKTWAGDYGEFLQESSRVLERDGELISAALVTRYQGTPFLAFLLTSPRHQRQGLGRQCLLVAMEDLRERGESTLRLKVTLANEPARLLYERLGFVIEE